MKFFFALFTVVTLQLCLIQAREVEEQNVEDQLLDVEAERDIADSDFEELDDSDLDEEFEDSNSVELRARPSKRPFCERTKRTGWGGTCVGEPITNMIGLHCDFIYPDETPNHSGEEVCRNVDEVCCVNCNSTKQTDNCNLDGPAVHARRTCCAGELDRRTLDSGCRCCGKCLRTTFCRRKKGFCVTKDDPVNSVDYCLSLGWRISTSGCTGKRCACCLPTKAA